MSYLTLLDTVDELAARYMPAASQEQLDAFRSDFGGLAIRFADEQSVRAAELAIEVATHDN